MHDGGSDNHITDTSLDWTRIVAERISEAAEQGAFDNLPGRGRPLLLEDDPLTPAHLRITNRVLKNAKVVPGWLTLEQEIEAAKHSAEALLERWTLGLESGLLNAGEVAAGRIEYERKLRHANDLILKHNLISPFVHRAPIPFRVKDRLAEWDKLFAALTADAAAEGGT